jgi:hypothetical protein
LSSFIKCHFELKNIDLIKKVLDSLEVKYQESTKENQLIGNYYRKLTKDVDLLVPKSELKKIKNKHYGAYGDLGFKYNEETGTYDILIDHYDKELSELVNKLYSIEVIKNFATNNRKNYTITSNSEDITSLTKEVVIKVY